MADALFRGVYAQVLIAAIEWLKLPEGSCLYVEGVEDVDVRAKITNELGDVEESERQIQVKQFDRNVSVRTPEVAYAVAQFACGYVQARQRQVNTRFIFTTSAGRARQQIATESAKVLLDVDVLKEWSSISPKTDRSILEELWKNLKSLLLGSLDEFGKLKTRLPSVIRGLDQDGGWEGFVRAVDWNFEHGDIGVLRRRLLELISADSRLAGDLLTVSPEYFAKEIVVEIVHRSGVHDMEKRRFDRLSFSRLAAHAGLTVNAAKSELSETYREYIYLEMNCWGVRVISVLWLASIRFVDLETAAFLSSANEKLAELECPPLANILDVIERKEIWLSAADWAKLLPFVVYVVLAHPDNLEEREHVRRSLATSARIRLTEFQDLLEESEPDREYSESCTGHGFIELGSSSHKDALSLAKLAAAIVSARLISGAGGDGARRLYESIRFKVKVAIDLESRAFSEPDRPIP